MARKKQVVTSEKTILQAQTRTEMGKKVKTLRKNGMIPANVFGQDFKSLAITVTVPNFMAAYKIAHETGIVYIEHDKESIPTLITHIQRHPTRNSILHIDFRKVNLKQKIETAVPIMIIGESEAVKVHNGVLLTQAEHLMVEALPADIPQHIEIDIAALKEIGQDIKVSDIKKSGSFAIMEEPEKVIVSVTAHKEESVTPETETAAPEVITEKSAEGEEGAEDGDGKADKGDKKEDKKE